MEEQKIKENKKINKKIINIDKKTEKTSDVSKNEEKNEYIIIPSKEKRKNQILKYENDDKENFEEIEKNVLDKCSEKEKIKDEYKKIYQQNFKNNFINHTNNKKKKYVYFVILIIMILMFFLSIIFALININNEKIINGVSIMGIDVSGKSLEETKQILNERVSKMEENNICLKYEDYETSMLPEQIETTCNTDDIAYEAFEIGRNGNIFQNNFQILNSYIKTKDLELNININDEQLNNMMYNISTELPNCVVQSSYYIDENKLIITNGKEGIIVDQDKVKTMIIDNIKNQIAKEENDEIKLPVQIEQPNPIDIIGIYNEIHRPAQDAYYTSDPVAVYPDVYGVDFAISLDEAKNMILDKQDKYQIPLKVLEPKIKLADLGAEAFPNVIGTFRTNYDNSATNKATNISLAAKAINGTILLPGQTFSYNKIVGDTTAEKGYKLGGTYVNGKVVQSYGGGICQVSSTLYNAVVMADLEVVMRYNHTYPVGYVAAGRDATVSYGTKDFQFKNSRTYPIQINASAKNGVLKMEIDGIQEQNDCEVSIESKVIQTIPYKVTYTYNSDLAKGSQKVTVNGCNGYKSIAYKVKKMNGATVSKEVLSQDTYNAMNRVIDIGTKE